MPDISDDDTPLIDIADDVAPDPGKTRRRLPKVTPRDKQNKSSKPAPDLPPYRAGMLVDPFTQMYTQIGSMAMLWDPTVGGSIVSNAEACATSLDNLAQKNPKVRRTLQKMLQTSAMGEVLIAHAPIILALTMRAKPDLLSNTPFASPEESNGHSS